jgi:hypothetical protein
VSVAVLTSVYGGYDPVVRPPQQTIDVEWVCVSEHEAPAPWRTVVEWRPHLHPRMAAKFPRCRPDLYTDADVTVWLDASARIKSPDTIERLIAATDRLGMFRHPERQNIRDEANYSAGMEKYRDLPMTQQVDAYQAAGMPGNGLWATGCIVRTEPMRDLGDRWLAEMWRWGWQDQLSIPYVLWQAGITPSTLPGDLWSNDLVEWSYSERRSQA